MKTWWLNVSYSLEAFDRASVDLLIVGVLGEPSDSGAGFGAREMHFPFTTKALADRAKQKIEAAGLPVPLEITVGGIFD